MAEEPAPTDEDVLIECVRRALDASGRGEVVDLVAICGDHPELADAVAEAVGLGHGLGALRAPAPADPTSGEVASTDAAPVRVLAGRYRLDAVLGRGAMGVVWDATDLELRRDVAVKLFETLGRARANDDERFRREAEALAALRHEHVVVIHDRGQDQDGTLFLVMERLRGAPLSALMELTADGGDADLGGSLAERVGSPAGAPPPESTWLRLLVRWCADVASGLGAAHAHGVFHRDVKPSNVFVRRDLSAVLLDFGIAARAGDPALTAGDAALGTPWYMAPEQASGEQRASAAIDVYGLSASLYHLLTGAPPFEGDAMQVVARLQREDPRPPAAVRSDLPRDLCAILEKGMERDLRRRYQTVAALEADLRAFLAHRPVSARPLGRVGRFARRVRRAPARALAIAASVAAVLLLVVLVPLWSRSAARARAVERDDLFASLPALLAIEGEPHQRPLQDLAERGVSLAVLDRMLELDPDDLPNRLWRAALRVDQGEQAAAADDLRQIVARAGDSDYVRAVAERYLRADPAVVGTEAIEFAGLPEPRTTFDRFVAGFHELRNRHLAGFADRAFGFLEPIADAYPPARELRVITLLYLGEIRRDAAAFQRAMRDTDWLAGFYGQETARTLALRGAALAGLGRYAEAVVELAAADARRPGRHGPLHNLGVAYRRLGEHAKAQDYLERAHALRPHFWNTTYMLGLLHKDRGDYDRALELADALPAVLSAAHAWRAPELRATVFLRRAVTARDTGGDPVAYRADAAAAIAEFGLAIERAGSEGLRQKLGQRQQLAAFLVADDVQGATRALVELLARTPDDPYEISNLAAILPSDRLDEAGLAAVRAWLRRLAIALAAGDPAFQLEQRALLDAGERR